MRYLIGTHMACDGETMTHKSKLLCYLTTEQVTAKGNP